MTSKSRFAGERVSFAAAFKDVSRGVRRVKQAEYLPFGAHPVVDQGKGFVAGYSNEESGLFANVPAIVFGDHTRIVKYVDEPFFAGADGVKILKPNLSSNVRYWYHALRATGLEDLGYSRHFKLLREKTFSNPSEEEQESICDSLDGVLRQIELCKKQLDLLDQLVKSQFVEMFETDDYPKKAASCFLRNIRNGLSPCREGMYKEKLLTLSAITRGAFDFESWKEGAFESRPPNNKRVSKGLFYVCRGNGNKALVGAAECSPVNRPDLVFPDTIIAAEVDEGVVCPDYLAMAWKRPRVRLQIEAKARTTNGTYKINQEILKTIDIPVPPLALQQEFADFVAQVNKSEFAVRQQIEKLRTLYDSLAQEYFG